MSLDHLKSKKNVRNPEILLSWLSHYTFSTYQNKSRALPALFIQKFYILAHLVSLLTSAHYFALYSLQRGPDAKENIDK